MMNARNRIAILKRLQERNPDPKIGLRFSSTFELLIAVLLSSHSRETTVNKAITNLYPVANTPEKVLKLGIEGIKPYIKTVGLFNRKSESIIKICEILIKKYGGEVPEDRTALESLPGIGRKTANVILNMAFRWPTIAVDTHVFRVCNRTNLARGKNVKQVEKSLLDLVPEEFKMHCHNWLVLHGRLTCISRKPLCKFCIIMDLCEFQEKII